MHSGAAPAGQSRSGHERSTFRRETDRTPRPIRTQPMGTAVPDGAATRCGWASTLWPRNSTARCVDVSPTGTTMPSTTTSSTPTRTGLRSSIRPISALIEDIYDRGLDKRVMVVVTGEFGRTPRISHVASSGSGVASAPKGNGPTRPRSLAACQHNAVCRGRHSEPDR